MDHAGIPLTGDFDLLDMGEQVGEVGVPDYVVVGAIVVQVVVKQVTSMIVVLGKPQKNCEIIKTVQTLQMSDQNVRDQAIVTEQTRCGISFASSDYPSTVTYIYKH